MPRLHHVNLAVPPGRTAEVLAFYEDVLHLVVVAKPTSLDPRGAWLQIDAATQLHLSERDAPAHPDTHMALVVDDLDETLASLAAARAPWQPAEDVFGGRRGFTRDPAGNRVELLELLGPEPR